MNSYHTLRGKHKENNMKLLHNISKKHSNTSSTQSFYIRKNHALRPLLVLMSAFLSSAICPLDAISETATHLETMTVTAERFPVEEKQSARFVTVITAEEMLETGANNLVDALKRAGNLTYKSFGPLGISHGGMNSSLTIRGIKDGELVLINGSSIQGAAGHAYDLNSIPVEQVERVEILRGAASTLYGADAMSGVINIITKKPSTKQTFSASAEAGDDSYQHYTVSASLPSPVPISAGIDYQHLGSQRELSRSFSKKYRYDLDPMERYAWNLNMKPLGALSENLFLDYLGSVTETGFKKIYDNPKKPFEGTDQIQTKQFASLRYEAEGLKGKIFGNYDVMERDPYTTPLVQDDENKNYNFGMEGDYKLNLAGFETQTGAEWVYRGADYNNQYGRHHRNDYAMFVQAKKAVTDRFSATLGLREQFMDGETGTKDHNKLLPSLGLSFKATDEVVLFADAGKAFRAPTFNNLYYKSDFLVGNPNLGPEEGWTYEAGVKYDNDFIRLRLAAFYMIYSDKIELDRSKGYPQTYFNANDYESSGVEWEFSVMPFIYTNNWMKDVMLKTSGYWADPTAEDTAGKRYQAGAKFQSGFAINYVTEPMQVELNYQMIASRERALSDYGVMNASCSYKIGKGSVKLAVDNIFDEKEFTSGDMTAGSSNQYVYYETGRLAKIGYEIRF